MCLARRSKKNRWDQSSKGFWTSERFLILNTKSRVLLTISYVNSTPTSETHFLLMRSWWEMGFRQQRLSLLLRIELIRLKSTFFDIIRIVVSFLNEFSLQEEHLHSAATYYYPISRTLQLPIMGYMSTSLLFSIGVVTYLINKFLGNYEKMNLNLPLPILVVSWIWVWEYGLMSSTFFTLLIAITLAFLSIGTDMHKVLILKVKSIP